MVENKDAVRRYMLFATAYPDEGGMSDFVGAYDDLDEAFRMAGMVDWHVFDTHRCVVISPVENKRRG